MSPLGNPVIAPQGLLISLKSDCKGRQMIFRLLIQMGGDGSKFGAADFKINLGSSASGATILSSALLVMHKALS
jgi:hypothetical protein